MDHWSQHLGETTTHFGFRVDLNGDGQLTLDDLPAWLVEAFFVPGNWLIEVALTHAAPVAHSFGIDAGDYGGALSGVMSAVAWLLAARLVISACNAARDLNRALTRSLAEAYQEARRRVRVSVTLLGYWLRRRLQRQRPDQEAVVLPEELEISDQAWRVLRLHSELRPGYALVLSEIAAALQLSRNETRQVLERLLQPGLLAATLGGGDGENSYTLTRIGRAFLACQSNGSLEGTTQSLPICPSLD